MLLCFTGNEDLVDSNSGEDIGNVKMGSTLHWGASPEENRFYLTTAHMYVNPVLNVFLW